MKEKSSSQRLLGLDVMRIILAIIVFLFHSWCHMGCSYGILQEFVRLGALTMTGFFMLSGFSLRCANVNKDLNDSATMRKFYVKRIVSIMPLYYVVAFGYTILWVVTGRLELWKSIALAPIEIIGIQSMFSSLFSIAHNQGTWFISDMLLCYLLFPWINTVVQNCKLARKKVLIVGLWFVLSYSPWIVKIFEISSIYTNPFFRGLEFMMGSLLYDVYCEVIQERKYLIILKNKISSYICWCGLIVGVIIAVKLGVPSGYVEYNFFVIPMFAIIIFTSSANIIRNRFEKIIKYTSNITYAFFLAQFFTWKPIEIVTSYLGLHNGIIKIVMAFVLCSIISMILYEMTEKIIKEKMIKRIFL